MTYESMIDNLNENSQLQFFNYTMESIGFVNEGVSDIFKAIKNGLLSFFRMIKEKFQSIIGWIKEKIFKSSDSSSSDTAKKELSKMTPEQKKQVTDGTKKDIQTYINSTGSDNKPKSVGDSDLRVSALKINGNTIEILDVENFEKVVIQCGNEFEEKNNEIKNLLNQFKNGPKQIGDADAARGYLDGLNKGYSDLEDDVNEVEKMLKGNPFYEKYTRIINIDSNTIDILEKHKSSATRTITNIVSYVKKATKAINDMENEVNSWGDNISNYPEIVTMTKKSANLLIRMMKLEVDVINKQSKILVDYKKKINATIKIINKNINKINVSDLKTREDFEKALSNKNATLVF